MKLSCLLRRSFVTFATLMLILSAVVSNAQQAATRGDGPDTLPDTPQVLGSGAQRFRVVPIKGFFRPSALAFLPNGDILVAERSGGLRIGTQRHTRPPAHRERASRGQRPQP